MAQFVLLFAGTIVMSVLLAPDQRGLLVAVTSLPTLLCAIGMFGLPSSVYYFAGRGSSVGSLERHSYFFTVLISALLVGIVWVALPFLEATFLGAARDHDDMLRVVLVVVPLSVLSAFGGWILYGRQAVRVFNRIQIVQAAVSLGLSVVLVGVLKLGVWGGIESAILANLIFTVAVMTAVRRLRKRDPDGPPLPRKTLLSYSARLYPSTVFSFLNFRADTYLLQALLLNSAYPLGLYALSVRMAEVVLYIPDSLATIFLPKVAGSSEVEAAAMLGRVGRLSVLLTALFALCLIPVAFFGVHLILAPYAPCLPAFLVLLPGAVSLSVAKVMAAYLAGRGRPELVSVATMVALTMNVALNVALIPAYGIVGAAVASLASYTVYGIVTTIIAGRLSGQSPLALCVPRGAEVRVLVDGARRIVRRVAARPASPAHATDVP